MLEYLDTFLWKTRFELNDYVWMFYCLNIVGIIDFIFQRVSLIFKGNFVQISNFLLCICLGGAS